MLRVVQMIGGNYELGMLESEVWLEVFVLGVQSGIYNLGTVAAI